MGVIHVALLQTKERRFEIAEPNKSAVSNRRSLMAYTILDHPHVPLAKTRHARLASAPERGVESTVRRGPCSRRAAWKSAEFAPNHVSNNQANARFGSGTGGRRAEAAATVAAGFREGSANETAAYRIPAGG